MSFNNFILGILIALGVIKIPKSNPEKARIDGPVLFSDEYNDINSYRKVKDLFFKKVSRVIVRIPFSHNGYVQFSRAANYALSTGMTVIAALDQYYSDTSFRERLDYVRRITPQIKHIELLNELPWMTYAGDQIISLQSLIDKINEYTKWIHTNMPGSKVLSMAPYNCLDREKHKEWNTDNYEIQKRMVTDTICDIVAIHCYGTDNQNLVNFKTLQYDLDSWCSEAQSKYGFRKPIWITECGIDDWSKHINYYEQWCSRFAEHLCAEAIIWYRMSIPNKKVQDWEFALEERQGWEHSPLFQKLES